MLILFDIDATLVTTSRAGVAAMGDSGRELFGPHFREDTVEYAGRLDPLIIADLLRAHAIEITDATVARFRDGYARWLAHRLATPGVSRALPGVAALVDRLAHRPDLTLGLLTGNYPETGELKLRAAGLDPHLFPIRAWGCDSPHTPPSRNHLPPVAVERHFQRTGARLPFDRVVIIGDTPHDVACALTNGCRALAVATGMYDRATLAGAGAHLAVDDLADVEEIESWITSTSSNGRR